MFLTWLLRVKDLLWAQTWWWGLWWTKRGRPAPLRQSRCESFIPVFSLFFFFFLLQRCLILAQTSRSSCQKSVKRDLTSHRWANASAEGSKWRNKWSTNEPQTQACLHTHIRPWQGGQMRRCCSSRRRWRRFRRDVLQKKESILRHRVIHEAKFWSSVSDSSVVVESLILISNRSQQRLWSLWGSVLDRTVAISIH